MSYDEFIKKYFPYDSFRKGQFEVIKDVLEAFESYDYVVLGAGTGFGKSAVARTILDYKTVEEYNDAYLLTSTKMLQEQYYDECKSNEHHVKYNIAKGRGNFACREHDMKTTCSHGACQDSSEKYDCGYGMIGNDPRNNGGCYYWEQKGNAIKSDVAIMNYDVLLSDYPNHYKFRNLMVLDEAHNIDAKVMARVGLTLNQQRLHDVVGFRLDDADYKEKDINYWVKRLKELEEILADHILNNYKYYHSKREMDQIRRLSDSISKRVNEIEFDPNFWFVNPLPYEKKMIIKPRDVSGYVKPLLLDNAEKHLFMSGSIIDKTNFVKYLGLSDDDVYYAHAESTFDMKKNNPIIKKLCGGLTYRNKEKTLPKTYPIIEEILREHQGEKGIIHCNSREFRDKIMNNVHTNRFLTYDSSIEKEALLDYFKESEYDNVIVAYSLEEGVDLPYNNINFQIIFKVPYPFLGDAQVKARKDADNDWYIIETIRKMVQIQGRGMRAEDDYCTNYVLDSSFNGLIRNKLCPKSFKECVV